MNGMILLVPRMLMYEWNVSYAGDPCIPVFMLQKFTLTVFTSRTKILRYGIKLTLMEIM